MAATRQFPSCSQVHPFAAPTVPSTLGLHIHLATLALFINRRWAKHRGRRETAQAVPPIHALRDCSSLSHEDMGHRRRSVDVGGLALALGEASSGYGWGGWEEAEKGETRFAC